MVLSKGRLVIVIKRCQNQEEFLMALNPKGIMENQLQQKIGDCAQ
jgi:hypothetical protein